MIQPVNLQATLEGVTEYWSPKVVKRVNDQYVKVAKLKGGLTWHMHDQEDALFQVIYGSLRIEFKNDAEVILSPGEFRAVPKGFLHNLAADEEYGLVLIETISTKHTGDVITPHTRTNIVDVVHVDVIFLRNCCELCNPSFRSCALPANDESEIRSSDPRWDHQLP